MKSRAKDGVLEGNIAIWKIMVYKNATNFEFHQVSISYFGGVVSNY